jgi:phospholipid/cholesterol/gamma-HCH transport system substrate-binding protein
MSSEAKVGIFVIIALALSAYVIYFLAVAGTHPGGAEYYALFRQAQGLQNGAPVRMAGVDIGEVTNIRLTPDSRARVTFRLQKGIPLRANYRLTIASGALLGESYLDIAAAPGRARQLEPGETLVGVDLPTLQDLVTASQALVTELQTTVGALNETLQGPELLPSLEQALNNVGTAAHQAALFATTLNTMAGENRVALHQSVRNLELATAQARAFTQQMLPRLAASAAPEQIEEVLANLSNAAEEVAGIAQGLREIAQDPALAGNIRAILDNVRAASANITEMSATLKEASENVRLSSESFRKTTETVQQTSVTAQDTVEKVHGMVTRVEESTNGLRNLRLPKVGISLDAMYLPRPDRVWSDANLDIRYGEGNSAIIGISDIGESDGFNFQLGRALGGHGRLRYGIVESKVGLGMDRQLTPQFGLTADLFDPNHITANLLGYYRLGASDSDWDLVFGGRRLFADDSWGVGVRTRR